MIILLIVLLAALATTIASRREPGTLVRLGFLVSAVGLLLAGLAALVPNLLLVYLAAFTVTFGVGALLSALVVTRCGRRGLQGPR